MFTNHNCPTCGASGRAFNGAWFTRHRKARGLTQREVAKSMGVSQSYLCDIEQGRRDWTIERATRYRKAIDSLKPPRKRKGGVQ